MPVLKLYRNGGTAGCAPRHKPHESAPRSTVGGWSASSIRRNTTFLYSVDSRLLTGHGYAATLTTRLCPRTSDEWHTIRATLIKWLRRRGLVRLHWVIEWQRRGVPHFHIAFWLPEPMSGDFLVEFHHYWRKLTDHLESAIGSQHITPIDNATGWFQYVSKHAARGLGHYQRSPENVPPEWQGKTGRMWGKVGKWPTDDEIRLDVTGPSFHRYRRLARRWRVANARADLRAAKTPEARRQALRRITSARTMLSCSDPRLAFVRGVSEWIPLDVNLLLATHAVGDDHSEQGLTLKTAPPKL